MIVFVIAAVAVAIVVMTVTASVAEESECSSACFLVRVPLALRSGLETATRSAKETPTGREEVQQKTSAK